MPEAARLTDPITHTSALAGLIGGALLGAAIGAAVVLTGGAAAGALAAAATVGAGASLGSMFGEFLGSFLTLPTGAITATGSSNVLIGGLPAARAATDFAMCSGIPFTPAPHPNSVIAQGSLTVFINNLPAARKGDALVCSATIASGCKSVIIGGEDKGTYATIEAEVPAWLGYSMLALGMISGAGVLRLSVGMTWVGVGRTLGMGFLGSVVGGEALGRLGGAIFGENSAGQRIMGFLGSLLGGAAAGGLGFRGARRAGIREYAQRLKARNGGKHRVEMPQKRVDLDGKAHRLKDGTPIETPHVVDANPPHPPGSSGAGRHPGYNRHKTRPATMKDLREVDAFLESQGK